MRKKENITKYQFFCLCVNRKVIMSMNNKWFVKLMTCTVKSVSGLMGENVFVWNAWEKIIKTEQNEWMHGMTQWKRVERERKKAAKEQPHTWLICFHFDEWTKLKGAKCALWLHEIDVDYLFCLWIFVGKVALNFVNNNSMKRSICFFLSFFSLCCEIFFEAINFSR